MVYNSVVSGIARGWQLSIIMYEGTNLSLGFLDFELERGVASFLDLNTWALFVSFKATPYQ